MKPTVQVVDTQMAAMHAVRELNLRGYGQDDIHVLAHDGDRTEALNEAANTKEIDRSEEGVFNSMANLFRSRGDELRAKLEAVGLDEQEAARYEQELDRGKVLVIANVH
ncbi:general stress protein [Paenibacillus sambharensis]|uniref:General stress protein n=1 Tax=Paenibacillus sambharensis TaxID=1803190 RepID=A0A2W1LKE2_9BACL|nr:general stress protein [Paenibacillus sambharensis]PZD94974.1 general stress protein [Paenibacillus sambharensis]